MERRKQRSFALRHKARLPPCTLCRKPMQCCPSYRTLQGIDTWLLLRLGEEGTSYTRDSSGDAKGVETGLKQSLTFHFATPYRHARPSYGEVVWESYLSALASSVRGDAPSARSHVCRNLILVGAWQHFLGISSIPKQRYVSDSPSIVCIFRVPIVF